jgi:hypothetical protein
MIKGMASPHQQPKKPPTLWTSILLLIIFVCLMVTLFSALVYLLVSGAERLGGSTTIYIAILVIISGVFAWLVKRLSDTISGMSQFWFPEDSDLEN